MLRKAGLGVALFLAVLTAGCAPRLGEVAVWSPHRSVEHVFNGFTWRSIGLETCDAPAALDGGVDGHRDAQAGNG